MSDPRDYYEVLGLARDADAEAIKDAFRNLALKFHPDRNKGPDAEEKFKEIAQAYAVLSSPQKRADYDARGFAGVAGFSQEDLFADIDFEDIFGGLHFGFGSGSPFDGFFRRQRVGPARGANIEVALELSLERIARGGEDEIRLARQTKCSACHGTGEKDGVTPPVCKVCQGSGRIASSRRNDKENVLIQHISTCNACEGRGFVHDDPCPACKGEGEVAQDDALIVTIPVGVDDGMVLRIPGKGMPSPDPGGQAGDLLAVVRTQSDARFKRIGADLVRIEVLSVVDAVLGTTLNVPTLSGSVHVVVPPCTQPDTVLRVKEKGLPAFGSGLPGDLYVQIGVQLPEALSPQEHELYEKLRGLAAQHV